MPQTSKSGSRGHSALGDLLRSGGARGGLCLSASFNRIRQNIYVRSPHAQSEMCLGCLAISAGVWLRGPRRAATAATWTGAPGAAYLSTRGTGDYEAKLRPED